jgi:CRISPR/Cas system CSM-associated protein Csm3 (group 7 of RAMP superfamily)
MTQSTISPEPRIKRNQREIQRRIIVRGCLALESPTCLGSGDSDSPTDMPLLRDSISQSALLTGASIAGSLRSYLREYEKGHAEQEADGDLATVLFGTMRQDSAGEQSETPPPQTTLDQVGTIRQDNEGDQSPLITFDSVSSSVPSIELRDGVKISSKTGTAEVKVDQESGAIRGGAKYDFELLAPKTIFPLQFELLIDKNHNENRLRKALTIALQGLENGEISLGMKKRRGFGRCKVAEWQVWDFDLTDLQQCREWLEFDHWTPGCLETAHQQGQHIADLLGVTLNPSEDQRKRFTLEATFSLDGSLLIRSGQANTGKAPDVVHLKSNGKPVVSGTSLAGVLRHRAERIVKTLQSTPSTDEPFLVKALFGDVDEKHKTAQASRLIVHEAEIKKSHDMVQNRIAIDRFTGGAYHGALFDEQPVWGGDNTELTIELELRSPKEYEIGLLLLLLKDLWTGDLPVGGESSIGRGRLKGKEAIVTHYQPGQQNKSWKIIQGDQHLEINNPDELESFVQALVDEVSEEVAA